MANVSYTASANVAVSGITPATTTDPKPTVAVTAAFNSGATAADDYLSEVYTVNAGTAATALNLGKITAGLLVLLQTTGPIMLTVTQDQGAGPVDVVIQVDTFLLLESGFLGLKVANSGATAAKVSVSVLGNRPALGTGPGVF